MPDIDGELMRVLPKLGDASKRVALACAFVEHLMPLYRMGNLKYAVKDVGALSDVAGLAPEQDLIELALELAWRFVLTGQHEAQLVDPIVAMLRARPHVTASATTSLASNGPIFGLIDGLSAIADPTNRSAMAIVSRARNGVFRLVEDLDEDEDAPGDQKDLESAWQLRVAQLLAAHGDAPITRELFDDVLAERLPWHDYLPNYEEKWAGGTRPPKPVPKRPSTKQPDDDDD